MWSQLGHDTIEEGQMNRRSCDSRYLAAVAFVCSLAAAFADENRNDNAEFLVGRISLIVREPVLRELQIEQDSPERLKIRMLLKSFPSVLQQRLLRRVETEHEPQQTPQEVYSSVEAEFVGQLKEILSSAQFARLQQIHWQRWGAKALHDSQLVETLEFTPEQLEKLRMARSLFDSQISELVKQRDETQEQRGDISDFRRKLQVLERDRARAYDAVLTAEQRMRFVELKGRLFELAPIDPTPSQSPGLTIRPRSGGLFFLATREPVQNELGIDRQFSLLAELRDLAAEYSAELKAERRRLSQRERDKYRDLESELQEKYLVQLKKLLSGDQYRRLQQIHWQQLGNEALNDLDVATELEMTAEQQERIGELNQELVNKVKLLVNEPHGPSIDAGRADQLKKQVLAAKHELDDQILQILSETQQARFEKLKGKPFDLDLLKSSPSGDTANATRGK